MKYILFIVSFFVACPSGMLHAQKQFKPVKAALKSKNGTEALKQVEELTKDSLLCEDPQLYDYGKEAQILINNVENEKAYLKQSYDTAKFFNSTLGIYDYILRCDVKEQQRLAKEGKKMKFVKGNQELLHRYYSNINAGARYFYSKKQYASAMPLLKHSIQVPLLAIWGSNKSAIPYSNYQRNAYLYLKSAYLSNNYSEVFTFKNFLLEDSNQYRCKALEYMSLSAEALKDSIAYYDYLKLGLKDYPQYPFFFTRWADYCAERGDYQKLVMASDSLLQMDSTCVVFWEGKSLALLNLQRYEEAIETSKRCLMLDTTAVEANYYVGAAYCSLAANIIMPTNINSKAYKQAAALRKKYYTLALPYVENYRCLVPDAQKRWGPLLYSIYFSLNMGKKFEEIEQLMVK